MDKFFRKIVWLVIILPAVYLAIVWNKLPEKVAMHFDLKGNVDRFGSKNELIIMSSVMIFMNVVVYLILTNIYRIDPKRYAAENKNRLYRIGFVVSVFISAVLCLIIYSSIHGDTKFSTRLILAGAGLLFAFIGNYMHNIKPNYFAGFRLPWTLENEDNWKATHLMASKIWFAGGILIAILALFIKPIIMFFVMLGIVLIMVVIPAIYSYRFYKKHRSTPQSPN